MIEIDFSKCKVKPYAHQARGIKTLCSKPRYALWWEMRLGKTKAIVDSACFLWEAGLLRTVVIACPAQVKGVWAHPEVGEIAAHAFVPHKVLTFDSSTAEYLDLLAAAASEDLVFIVVSHELLRQQDKKGDFPRVNQLLSALDGIGPWWLVFDEASAFGNHRSLQTKSALALRSALAGRVTLLDGTPVGNHPIEQYSKFKLLGEDVLGYKNFFHFRAAHQVAEPSPFARRGSKYAGFKNQARIDARVRPFCEYLEQKDALDMPEKVTEYQVVRLGPKAWLSYCSMRDEMCAELESGHCTPQHASVKALRLAQLCAGFLGGVEDDAGGPPRTEAVGEETAAALVEWVKLRLAERPDFKCVVWARWRPEIERLARLLVLHTTAGVRMEYGGKHGYDGELHPTSDYAGSLVLVAQPQALRYGVNLSRADTEVFLSQDYNRITRAQSEERIQMPCTRSTSLLVEFLVEGPQGQKTVTWDIRRALADKEDVARRTAGEWKRALEAE